MKIKIYSTALAAVAAVSLSGCIDEVSPSGSTITTEQLQSSVKAGEAAAAAMPSTLNICNSDATAHHCDFGYPALMIIRDRCTGDMTWNPNFTNYDWFSNFAEAAFDEGYWMPQQIGNFYGQQILACNESARAFPEDAELEAQKGARAVSLAFRAFTYLDVARWYEYLPCDATSSVNANGNNVLNLTYPIVTENTTETEAANNPRATREQMFEFIKSDLDYAAEHINDAPASMVGYEFPNLAVVYGLYARLYMWVENYPEAKVWADKAIAESGKTPLTEAQWTDPINGFNNPDSNNSWMFCGQYAKENRAITTGIVNWISFMSPEYSAGYASAAGGGHTVDNSFYQKISTADFRKFSWCPTNLILQAKVNLVGMSANKDKIAFCGKNKLASIKFRCGEGETADNTVACVVAFPLMRVEEMHFISIEAEAHSNPSAGKAALENFMKTYRYSSYACKVSSEEEIIDEIIFQKRVELWGEGQTMWDIKRLNMSVTRGYPDTNFYEEVRFNTNGRPAWTNMVFLSRECEANKGLYQMNNPNTYGVYKAIPDSQVGFNASKW